MLGLEPVGQELSDILCCPTCRSSLEPVESGQRKYCPACGQTMSSANGVMSFGAQTGRSRKILASLPHELQAVHEQLTAYWAAQEAQTEYYGLLETLGAQDSADRRAAAAWLATADVVLDVGCGNGTNGMVLRDTQRYVGIDISRRALERAHQRLRYRPASLVQAPVWSLPFRDNSFDGVLCTYGLEHMVAPGQAIREMVRVLRREGCLVLVGPAWDFPFSVPPSTLSTTAGVRRIAWAAGRLFGQIAGLVRGDRGWAPKFVLKPEVFTLGYACDRDVCHVVTVYDTLRHLQRLNCTVEYAPTADAQYGGPIWSTAKSMLTHLPVWKYGGSEMFIVAKKIEGMH